MALPFLFCFGCGSSSEVTSPTTTDIAAFIEDNPEYAAAPQPKQEVRRNPETGKEETVAKPMDLGN